MIYKTALLLSITLLTTGCIPFIGSDDEKENSYKHNDTSNVAIANSTSKNNGAGEFEWAKTKKAWRLGGETENNNNESELPRNNRSVEINTIGEAQSVSPASVAPRVKVAEIITPEKQQIAIPSVPSNKNAIDALALEANIVDDIVETNESPLNDTINSLVTQTPATTIEPTLIVEPIVEPVAEKTTAETNKRLLKTDPSEMSNEDVFSLIHSIVDKTQEEEIEIETSDKITQESSELLHNILPDSPDEEINKKSPSVLVQTDASIDNILDALSETKATDKQIDALEKFVTPITEDDKSDISLALEETLSSTQKEKISFEKTEAFIPNPIGEATASPITTKKKLHTQEKTTPIEPATTVSKKEIPSPITFDEASVITIVTIDSSGVVPSDKAETYNAISLTSATPTFAFEKATNAGRFHNVRVEIMQLGENGKTNRDKVFWVNDFLARKRIMPNTPFCLNALPSGAVIRNRATGETKTSMTLESGKNYALTLTINSEKTLEVRKVHFKRVVGRHKGSEHCAERHH